MTLNAQHFYTESLLPFKPVPTSHLLHGHHLQVSLTKKQLVPLATCITVERAVVDNLE